MKQIIFIIILISYLNADKIDDKLAKARQEVKNLKRELDEYYVKKEIDFAATQKNNRMILIKIKHERREMEKLKKQMEKLLAEIGKKTKSKSIKIYSKMRINKLSALLRKMYANGEEERVFRILVKLKEDRVAKLFETFDSDMAITLLALIDNPQNKQLNAIKKKLATQNMQTNKQMVNQTARR